MDSILYQLFSGDYDITPKRDKKQQELYNKLFAELDKVQKAFGDEFLTHLLDLEGELTEQQSFQYYRSGFFLGARLMLEAIKA